MTNNQFWIYTFPYGQFWWSNRKAWTPIQNGTHTESTCTGQMNVKYIINTMRATERTNERSVFFKMLSICIDNALLPFDSFFVLVGVDVAHALSHRCESLINDMDFVYASLPLKPTKTNWIQFSWRCIYLFDVVYFLLLFFQWVCNNDLYTHSLWIRREKKLANGIICDMKILSRNWE